MLRRAGDHSLLAGPADAELAGIVDVDPGIEQDLQDGFAICRRIRSESDVPIILLTVRGEEEDLVRALERAGGQVTDEATAAFLADFMKEFRDHIERVLTVLPRS